MSSMRSSCSASLFLSRKPATWYVEVLEGEAAVAAEPRLLVGGCLLVVHGVEGGQQSGLVGRGAAVEESLLLQHY